MKIIHWMTAAALLTSSFDLFLAIQAGGTIRFTQIVLLGLMVCALGRVAQTGKILWPRGGTALFLWLLLQGLLIGRSVIPNISLQLYAILLFTIVGVFALLQLWGRSPAIETLMRTYLYTFVWIAGFGLFQAVAPALHLGEPLIGQWIVHGLIPRLNGFNYEPSYFATYLIMGWIMVIDLRITKARITSGRRWFWFSILLTTIFFLSTSKSAWLFMIVEAVARMLPVVWRIAVRQAGRLRRGSLVIPLPGWKLLVAPVVIVVAGSAGLAAVSRVVDPAIFLFGSGIGKTNDGSVQQRSEIAFWTWDVFKESPWVGLSLGGVSGRVAERQGSTIHNNEDLKLYWAFPVPLEVLAASGILGVLPFVYFFLIITVGERGLMRRRWEDDRAKWLHALIRAMAYEWLILMVDQNVLRVYLWYHVTMLVIIGYHLRYSTAAQPAASTPASFNPALRLTAAPYVLGSTENPATL